MSIGLCPPSFPADYVLVVSFAARGAVHAVGEEVVVSVLSRRFILKWSLPRICRNRLFKVGAIPLVYSRVFTKRLKAFLRRGVSPDIEPEQVKPWPTFLSRFLRHYLAFSTPKYAAQCSQTEDDHYDNDSTSMKPLISALYVLSYPSFFPPGCNCLI
jgi:hypothetical protein